MGKGPLNELGEVLVDVVVVPERELSAGPLYLRVVAPFVREQVLVVSRDHHVPAIPPDDDHVLHPPGLEVVSVHDRGTEHGETVSGKRYPESPPKHLSDPGAAGFRVLVDDV